jgi:hypothetical protein
MLAVVAACVSVNVVSVVGIRECGVWLCVRAEQGHMTCAMPPPMGHPWLGGSACVSETFISARLMNDL